MTDTFPDPTDQAAAYDAAVDQPPPEVAEPAEPEVAEPAEPEVAEPAAAHVFHARTPAEVASTAVELLSDGWKQSDSIYSRHVETQKWTRGDEVAFVVIEEPLPAPVQPQPAQPDIGKVVEEAVVEVGNTIRGIFGV